MDWFQKRRDRQAFWWWLTFERARRFEVRRGWFLVALMAIPELSMWEGQMSRQMQDRVDECKRRHRARGKH